MTAPTSSEPRGRVASRRRLVDLRIWAAALVIFVGLLGAFAWPGLRLDFYFDEVWRASLVRTPWTFERYTNSDTPLPPGWLVAMWSMLELLPVRRPTIRIAALVPALVALVVLTDIVRRLFRRRRPSARALPLAAATVALFLLEPGIAHQATYLNNYFAEIAVGAAVIWAVVLYEDGYRRAVLGLFLGAAALGPFLTQGAMFLLPLCLGWVFGREALRPGTRARTWLAASLGLAAITGLWCYLQFLRPISSTSRVEDYWRPDGVGGLGALGWFDRWWATFRDLVVPRSLGDSAAVQLALLVLVGLGGLVVVRVAPWWLAALGSAQAIAWLASFLVGWPVTVVRLNLGFVWLAMLLAPLGLVVLVDSLAVGLRQFLPSDADRRATVVVAGWMSLALATAIVAWPRDVLDAAGSRAPFARGLTDDLGFIAAGASAGDAVLGYHPMTSWYVHDRLVLEGSVPVVVVDELLDGDALVDDPSRLIAERAPAATTVWCVVPYELGPDGSTAACRLDTRRWRETEIVRLERAEIRRWVLR